MALGKQLPFSSKYKGQQNKYLFPSTNVDPAYKSDPKGEYVKNIIESMYCKYLNGSLGGTELYEKADLLQDYGRGMQPESIYRTWAYGGESYPTSFVQNLINGIDASVEGVSKALIEGWHNVNFSVVSPMPKIKETIKGMLDKVDYDIFADALDPISNDKKEKERLRLLVRAKNKDWYDAQRKAMSLPDDTPDFLPETKEDLDIYEAYGGLKLQCARIQQMLVRHTYEDSGWEEIRSVLLDHLMDYSKAVVYDRINLDTKK